MGKLQLWLNVNRLSLNISKTNFVIFHPFNKPLKHQITLKIQKTAISQKKHIRYLGVIIDSTLTWKQQIKNILCKISRAIGIMYKLSPSLNHIMLKNIYYSLIYSHIVYAIQVCGSAGKSEIDKILILQKRAIRLIYNKAKRPIIPGPLASTNPMFYKQDILTIQIARIVGIHLKIFMSGSN